jgi:hypothetical protein
MGLLLHRNQVTAQREVDPWRKEGHPVCQQPYVVVGASVLLAHSSLTVPTIFELLDPPATIHIYLIKTSH